MGAQMSTDGWGPDDDMERLGIRDGEGIRRLNPADAELSQTELDAVRKVLTRRTLEVENEGYVRARLAMWEQGGAPMVSDLVWLTSNSVPGWSVREALKRWVRQ